MARHDNTDTPTEEQQTIYCPRCRQTARPGKRLNQDPPICWKCEASVMFLDNARRKWGNRFDYSKEEKEPRFFDLYLTCNRCNSSFKTNPSQHLDSPTGGCKTCERLERANNFIKQAQAQHGEGRYIYDPNQYQALNKPITIKCFFHGEFTVSKAEKHLTGSGCPECKPKLLSGWNRTDFIKQSEYNNKGRARFYVISCSSPKEKPFIKIGITKNTLKKRFKDSRMPYTWKPLLELEGEAGAVYDLEQTVKRLNKALQYKPALPFAGHTESYKDLTTQTKQLLGLVNK